MTADARVHGQCERRFTAVRNAFAENFRSRDEVGAMVAVTLAGAPVIDLWGGFADRARTRPWAEDTLVCMMSVAKAVTATCVAMLVDRGLLQWDAPVAQYWPEFAANGKEDVPLRYLLDHRAGLPAIDKPAPADAAYDWELMTSTLAAQAPLWVPGSARAYHPATMGYLAGEVIRRVSGKSVGAFLAEEVCGPLGIDYWIGLPDVLHERCAEFFGETAGTLFDQSRPQSLLCRAMAQMRWQDINSPAFRRAEIPSINGIGTARGISRLFGVLACGGSLEDTRLLGEETLAQVTAEQWHGSEDLVGHTRRMAMGYLLGLPGHVALGPNPRAFGHTGAGGAVGFADPDARIGFAYAPNHMYSGPGISPRLQALVDALYAALD